MIYLITYIYYHKVMLKKGEKSIIINQIVNHTKNRIQTKRGPKWAIKK